jgi:DNA-binding CsgD family transcriptional regulator
VDWAAAVFEVVGALRVADDSSSHVLQSPGVTEALRRVLPAETVSMIELRPRHQRENSFGLFADHVPNDPFGRFWQHFDASLICSYTERDAHLRAQVMRTTDFYSDLQWHSTGMYAECMRPAGLDHELVMPLPGPPGTARRIVFFRAVGNPPFSDAERIAAVLLQPHIAEALRAHARRNARERLTARQFELLQSLASGDDIVAVARRLDLSPRTVRKHLENSYARLGVTSRAAAVAQAFPDLSWS